MRRAVVAYGVLGSFVAAWALASIAEARIGGGGSSGSRGSRSYSAPRSPSAPASPASPSQRAPAQPAPQRPGGLFGGVGGMLGGLLLGGLLGSLLFGGAGGGLGGGIGLLELLVMAGLAYLAISFFRRRQPAPAMESGYAPAGWAPAEASPRAGGAAVVPQDDEFERGLAAIRVMDPSFDPTRFTGIATDLFTRLQIGWSAGDLAAVRAQLADEMAVALETDLSRLRTLRRVNRVEKVSVESAELTEAWQEYGRDLVTVRFRARALDYTVDEATGSVVEGSNTSPTSFEEYWTFARKVGPNLWQLSAIQQPPA